MLGFSVFYSPSPPITALTAAAVPTAIDHLVAATAVASSAGLITAAVAPAAVTVALTGGCDVVATAAVATALDVYLLPHLPL